LSGTFGFVCTKSISEGDSRTSGLQFLLRKGCRIYKATTSFVWPGLATVNTLIVHIAKPQSFAAKLRKVILDDTEVEQINSYLSDGDEYKDPEKLIANKGIVYFGATPLGKGFLLNSQERDELINKDPKNEAVIFPYQGGSELNTNPDQSASRFIINFGSRSFKEVNQWPDVLRIIEERVNLKEIGYVQIIRLPGIENRIGGDTQDKRKSYTVRS